MVKIFKKFYTYQDSNLNITHTRPTQVTTTPQTTSFQVYLYLYTSGTLPFLYITWLFKPCRAILFHMTQTLAPYRGHFCSFEVHRYKGIFRGPVAALSSSSVCGNGLCHEKDEERQRPLGALGIPKILREFAQLKSAT